VLMVPAIGTVRSSASSPGVEIRSRTTAGVYDTAVLRAERADELLAWLDREGFAAPDGVEPVMQSYLDRGWVFAAAKVRSDAPGGEQRAHPLTY
ncbi:DUF2330 domain-containing protein, partial [Limnospira platensis]|uniref:DUF2330 domain-containing protein n=1 Tax=Limnospira platensis TaxID=118562 RepID=UPI003396C5F7